MSTPFCLTTGPPNTSPSWLNVPPEQTRAQRHVRAFSRPRPDWSERPGKRVCVQLSQLGRATDRVREGMATHESGLPPQLAARAG